MRRLNAGVLALSIVGLVWCEAVAEEAGPPLERIATGYKLAEGPVWDGESLYFTDVPTERILKVGSEGTVTTVRSDTRKGAGLAFDSKRRLLICEVDGFRVTRIEKDGTETTLAESYAGKKLNGPNDLAVDAMDGIYFKTSTPPAGRGSWSSTPPASGAES